MITTLLDGRRQLLHNLHVESRRRWIALVCLASLSIGPAAGIAVAAHELGHHGSEQHEHSDVARVATALVHGHFHDDGGEEHEHAFAPPSFQASRLSVQGDAAMPIVTSVRPRLPDSVLGQRGSPAEPDGLSPPSPFRLCVLRL